MKVEHTISINAPVNVVWAVTKDLEQWPEWTPTVTAIRCLDCNPLGLGSTVRIKQPGQPESDWTVTKYIPKKQLTWETHRRGLCMVATHQIHGNKKGSHTHNTLRVEVSGIIALLLRPVLLLAIRRALMRENQGLKNRCETF